MKEQELVNYCVENYLIKKDGSVFFKKTGPRRTLNKKIGHVNRHGYRVTSVKNKFMSVHRLAWILYYKLFPDGIIDHINGNRDDNRFENLRLVDAKENTRNTYKTRNGRLFGCHFCHYTKKWRAQIKINGKKKHLGRFNTELEAHKRFLHEHKILENLK